MADSKDILVFLETSESKKIFNSFISQGDMYIHFAEKNDDGLKKFTSQHFDLVIVEINKPLISEISFIENLHAYERSMPIVIVSEYFNETKDVLFSDTAYNYLPKPISLDKLSDTVKQAMAETNALKEIHEEQAKLKAGFENKKLSILYEISKSLHTITDLDKLLTTLVDFAKDTLSAERATVFILDKSTNELWSRSGTGINKREIRFNKAKGIAGKVASSGEFLIISDPYNNPEFNSEFDVKSGFKTRNLLSVPMKNIKGRVVGVFQVLNKKGGDFTEDDAKFLEAISINASITLENTQLHDEKLKKIEEMHLLYNEFKAQQKESNLKIKNQTVDKIIKLFKEAKSSNAMNVTLNRVKKLRGEDKELHAHLDKIGDVHEQILNIIEDYLQKMLSKK